MRSSCSFPLIHRTQSITVPAVGRPPRPGLRALATHRRGSAQHGSRVLALRGTDRATGMRRRAISRANHKWLLLVRAGRGCGAGSRRVLTVGPGGAGPSRSSLGYDSFVSGVLLSILLNVLPLCHFFCHPHEMERLLRYCRKPCSHSSNNFAEIRILRSPQHLRATSVPASCVATAGRNHKRAPVASGREAWQGVGCGDTGGMVGYGDVNPPHAGSARAAAIPGT
jgi:hypothetical protein